MTREQINNLIDKKIMGQGNQVDLGTALPSILRGIMGSSATTQEVDDFEDFDESTSYSEGDIVRKDGKLYKFTTDHDGAWSEDDVEQTNVMELLSVPQEPISTINVKIYKWVWNEDDEYWDREDENASGTLVVKGFKGVETIEAREIAFSNGVATFGYPTGATLGVTAKIADYGASIQFVNVVVGEEIEIELEVYPEGIYEMGDGSLSGNLQHTGDMYQGCVVVSKDFALLIPPHQPDDLAGEEDYRQWGGFFQRIPFLPEYANEVDALKDYDGALNTRAILSVLDEQDCAAREATRNKDFYYSRYGNFLPSLGQLKYLFDHKTAINGFIQGAMDEYGDEYYQLDNRAYWSSTTRDALSSWDLRMDYGYVYYDLRTYSNCVVGVSAFHTLY